MRLHLRKLTQTLPKTFATHAVSQARMDTFRQAMTALFARVDENQPEAYQKMLVADFLREAFSTGINQPEQNPNPSFGIDTDNQIDLVVRRQLVGQTADNSVPSRAVVEVRKAYAADMMTPLKNNVRALHELILYYFEERERQPSHPINQLIITDVYNWFLFSNTDFEQFFYRNPRLKKLYQLKQQQQKDNLFFYAETARILRDLDEEIPVTYLNLREAADALSRNPTEGNRLLLPIVNVFSPEHLLNLPITARGPVLNPDFYAELLYLIGLRETTVNRKSTLQRLPKGERQEGSLLELTIKQLQTDSVLISEELDDQYTTSEADPVVSIGLSLCFNWLNRILFLKMLEGQLRHRQQGDLGRENHFLSAHQIRRFDELHELFFDVLAVPQPQRSVRVASRYGPLPFLNSSLFELTELEQKTITIKKLNPSVELPLFDKTVLNHPPEGSSQTTSLPTLDYLLTFLDAYTFSPEQRATVQPDDRFTVTAATLGLLFEKFNGQSPGSFAASDGSVAYLTRDTLRRAVVARFNKQFNWLCRNPTELRDRLSEISLSDTNAVIHSLRIVDPAVGSGRFLVSALNELLVLKAELSLLTDRDGRLLGRYAIDIVGEELIISDETGELIDQYTSHPGLWEALFHEKKNLIETCLFGVDINPNAVQGCQVRLWLELLKWAYFTSDSFTSPALPPLPNLDLNLKTGNALAGKFGLNFRFDSQHYPSVREKFLPLFQRYRRDVLAYKRCADKTEKERIRTRIRKFQEFIDQLAPTDQKTIVDIRQLEAKLVQSTLTFDFVNQQDYLRSLSDRLNARKADYAEKQRVLNQAVEWRFAFPDVLDEAGNFVGFDVVLGEPPYDRLPNGTVYRSYLKKTFPDTYMGPADPYGPFLELGLKLLKPSGYLAYRLPNKWLTSTPGRKLRAWLKTKALEQLIIINALANDEKRVMHSLLLTIHQADAPFPVRVLQLQPSEGDQTESVDDQLKLINELSVDALPDDGWRLIDLVLPI